MKSERLKQMEAYLKESGICSMSDLCNNFKMSMVTIRRDVDELQKAGVIEKVYGGVRYIEKNIAPTLPYIQRNVRNVQEKEHIGKIAASIIRAGDSVFIDSGTTTLNLIKYVNDEPLNIATNSFNVIEECRCRDSLNIIVLGGEFSRLTNSFVGDSAVRAFSNYNISKAFIAATGASIDYGFSNSAIAESNIKKEAVARCRESYVMIDYAKWGVVSLKTFAGLHDVTGVITDRRPPEKYVRLLNEKGVKLLY